MKTFISALVLLSMGTPLCLAYPSATGKSVKQGNQPTETGDVAHEDTPLEQSDYDRTFASFPQRAGDLCKDQLNSVSVEFKANGPGSIRIDNVPPACMTLATLFLPDSERSPPIPLGSASLGFSGLSDDDLQDIQTLLDSHKHED
ncbi:hypothetical protein BDV28DRAFT_153168 [Aspergillus coremiiformis]|uniref:Uncharacterized protein n=1 Tax=Aspergillus coremiiformis TaxID=138285 RepID=A0A5N6YRL8_9EURO|nr:hypothetical protein BDV28DRAFT_153168 [Aspergillus coremiiformis]